MDIEWRPSILVVDDQPGIREILTLNLAGEGYEVGEAEDGIQALQKLRTPPYWDLVLLDLRMPVLDGPGVLKQMELDATIPDTPVILSTGTSEFDISPELRKHPRVFGVLRKPFDLETLFETVKEVSMLRGRQRF